MTNLTSLKQLMKDITPSTYYYYSTESETETSQSEEEKENMKVEKPRVLTQIARRQPTNPEFCNVTILYDSKCVPCEGFSRNTLIYILDPAWQTMRGLAVFFISHPYSINS